MDKNTNYFKEIGKRLKKVRTKLEMTQEDMAIKFSLKSKQSYGTIELGNRQIKANELKILLDQFNINPAWILCGHEEMFFQNNPKIVELTNLILDFRHYGGEVDLVRNEIIKSIIAKLFKTKKLFGIIRVPNSIFGDHILYALMQILMNSNFSEKEDNAKNYFRNKIESFDKAGGPFPSEVKKTLYSMLEKIDNKDCFYLFKFNEIASKQLLEKVSNIDKKLNHIFIKKDRKLHQLIDKQ